MPAAQIVQSASASALVPLPPVPAGLPNLPIAQLMQVSLVCFVSTLYFPAAQLVQSSSLSWLAAALASLALYVP